MKSLRLLTVLAVALVVAPLASAADFGIRAGRFNDADTEFVGIELLYDAGVLNINPNVEYLLEDDVTAGSVNVDVTVDVFNVAAVTPYLGAGVGLSYFDADQTGNETDVVGNLIGGVSFHLAGLEPYAQVKYVRLLDNEETGAGDDDDIALTIGLRF